MRARLGFSIACHSNPDILLIDEVFSVGDQDFRRKSKQKIEDMVRGETTVVIVSHSVSILENICDNIIYMKDGYVVVDDNQHYAISLYSGRA
jgi:ABC-type polysaccharide/polyol phosphate transport system ATPase subunit